MRQLLSDTEQDPDVDSSQATSIIFTPIASDSDYDELLESESLGDRSTTSTVPTQNSQRSQRWMSMSQTLSESQYAYSPINDAEKNRKRRVVEESEARQKEYLKRAVFHLKILLWASAAISVVATLFHLRSLGNRSFYDHRCDVFLGELSWDIVLEDPLIIRDKCFTDTPLRLLRKGKLLSKALFPSYYPSNTNTWTSEHNRIKRLEYPALIWFIYIHNFRYLVFWGYALFFIVILSDTILFRNIARVLRTNWITHNFALREILFFPIVAFFVYIPWESLLPHFLGISGMIDNTDRRGVSFGLKWLVISWMPVESLTQRFRSSSLARKVLWLVYSSFCAVWSSLWAYMQFFGGDKVEVKFEIDSKGLKH
ncbi:hypothetical protein TWF481_002334 [Arthrobotrys musiformis]|uniref:Uncharacterized protein n=1 Tax=Arthrobotrys musiformis TaxID=47236 RepID=A0AAV9VVB3_9PEZI